MALNIKLEAFEGPLDLLLHLIEKNSIDIYDIPISDLTDQYMLYITELDESHLDLASEFLVMAATLVSIKSKMLLPKPRNEEVQIELAASTEDLDPREELVKRLLEYKKFKEIAFELKKLEAQQDKVYKRSPDDLSFLEKKDFTLTKLSLDDLENIFLRLIKSRKKAAPIYTVYKDPIPLARRIKEIIKIVCSHKSFVKFSLLLKNVKSRAEKIVTFLAILELIRMNRITVKQENMFDEIIVYQKRG